MRRKGSVTLVLEKRMLERGKVVPMIRCATEKGKRGGRGCDP